MTSQEPAYESTPLSEKGASAEPETTSENELELTAETEASAEPETTPENEPEVTTETEASAEPETASENEPEVTAETETSTEPETSLDNEPEVTVETEVPTEPETTSENEPEPTVETELTPTYEVAPSIEPEASTEFIPEIEPTMSIVLPEISPEADPEAAASEIVIPPLIFVSCGFLTLFILYCLSKKRKIWKVFSRNHKKKYLDKRLQEFNNISFQRSEEEIYSQTFGEHFFTKAEIDALEKLNYFENSAKGLMFISVPPGLALLFCPMTLFLYTPLANFFWPKPPFTDIPNINDALACFLAPAGMVYAITFGFAVHDVLQRHMHLRDKLSQEVTLSREIICIIDQIEGIPVSGQVKVLKILKTNIINRILQAQDNFASVQNVNIWEIAEVVKNYISESSALLHVLFKNIQQLFSLIPENGPLYEHINPIQWIILETLSGFSFLGILMIKASSYRLEIAMCLITVVSITLLVFAVSDLDSPFDGFFRVHLTSLENFIYEVYSAYQQLVTKDAPKTELHTVISAFGNAVKS